MIGGAFRVLAAGPGRGWIRALFLSLLALGVVLGVSAGCSGGRTGNASASSAPAPGGSTHVTADSLARRPAPAAAESLRATGRAPGASGGSGAELTELELGAAIFQKNCARCHGPDGRGDGTGVLTLEVKPQNFHDAAHMATRTDEDLLITIRHGLEKGAMPRWDSILSEREIHAVMRYVRTFATRP